MTRPEGGGEGESRIRKGRRREHTKDGGEAKRTKAMFVKIHQLLGRPDNCTLSHVACLLWKLHRKQARTKDKRLYLKISKTKIINNLFTFRPALDLHGANTTEKAGFYNKAAVHAGTLEAHEKAMQ